MSSNRILKLPLVSALFVQTPKIIEGAVVGHFYKMAASSSYSILGGEVALGGGKMSAVARSCHKQVGNHL